ncbi:hypothetical protein CTI12_AA076200 [Artemisia annua]|uniref:Uncharacterized protein n=1 Tax=Artemisia annua TaxID=35608 RepID=A0A2U1Q4L9_ARTAN|nr:hypothetical protein CTI12_AA076200 [Artemisia annua]
MDSLNGYLMVTEVVVVVDGGEEGWRLKKIDYVEEGVVWVLNHIVEDLFQGHPICKRKLKELLGHTPSQVVAGDVLGILVACLCCLGFFGAI